MVRNVEVGGAGQQGSVPRPCMLKIVFFQKRGEQEWLRIATRPLTDWPSPKRTKNDKKDHPQKELANVAHVTLRDNGVWFDAPISCVANSGRKSDSKAPLFAVREPVVLVPFTPS